MRLSQRGVPVFDPSRGVPVRKGPRTTTRALQKCTAGKQEQPNTQAGIHADALAKSHSRHFTQTHRTRSAQATATRHYSTCALKPPDYTLNILTVWLWMPQIHCHSRHSASRVVCARAISHVHHVACHNLARAAPCGQPCAAHISPPPIHAPSHARHVQRVVLDRVHVRYAPKRVRDGDTKARGNKASTRENGYLAFSSGALVGLVACGPEFRSFRAHSGLTACRTASSLRSMMLRCCRCTANHSSHCSSGSRGSW